MDSESALGAVFVLLCGVFCIAASYFNWNFFFGNRRAKLFVKIFGRNGARLFYGALGIFLIAISLISLIKGV